MRVYGVFWRGEGKLPDPVRDAEVFHSQERVKEEFRRRISGEVSRFDWLARDDEAEHRVCCTERAALTVYGEPPQRVRRSVTPAPIGAWTVGQRGAPVFTRYRKGGKR